MCRTAPHGPTPAPILCAVQYLRPQQCRRRVCRCGQHPAWPAPLWRTHYSEIDRIEMTTLQPSGRLPQGSLVPDRTGFSPSVFRFFAEFPQRKPNYLGIFHPFRCKQGTYPKRPPCIILQLARTILQLARIILQLSCIILQLYPPFPREITPPRRQPKPRSPQKSSPLRDLSRRGNA